jgi:LPS export ABC transporter protein LptC
VQIRKMLVLVVALLWLTAACRPGSRAADKLAKDSSAAQQQIDTNLTFNNITLEQPDEKGQTLWKVKAKTATYTPDKATAKVTSPYGQLYQDGKPIYKIQANQGEVRKDGDRIVLTGDVVATDLKSGAVMRGEEMEWRPKRDLLLIRKNLRGTHPQLQMSADQAAVYNRQRRVELTGNVVAIASDPELQMQGELLVWRIEKKTVTSDKPIKVQRLKNKQVTDNATADKADVHLGDKVVNLTQNARLIMADPPVQVSGNSLKWNLSNQTLVADQPVTVFHQQQRVTLTASTGRMDLEPKIAYLNGDVRVRGQKNQANLVSDTLVWNIPTQRIEAEGNVVYDQINPTINLRGPRAVGKLENQTVVVSGGRVVTEFVPEHVR